MGWLIGFRFLPELCDRYERERKGGQRVKIACMPALHCVKSDSAHKSTREKL